jgi:UDP-glucose 4-epimerase
MKVLITGGAGFIGSHLAEHFATRAEVVILDNLSTGSNDNLADIRCDSRFGSVLNRMAVRRAMEGVDYVFHLAGMVSVEESMEKPVECAEVNTLGTLIVLEEAANAKVRKLLFVSSAAVYGDGPEPVRKESDHLEPKSPYAATKLAGEVYCQMFAIERKLNTVVARCFNVFGPRQDPKTGVVASFAYRAIRNAPLTINGNGRQTRDFIYVKNAVSALAFLALLPESNGTYNVGSGTPTSVLGLAHTLIELTGSRSEIHCGPDRPGDIKHSVASIDRLTGAGFIPSNHADELRTTIASLRP